MISTAKEIELMKKRDYLLTQSKSAPAEIKTVEEQIKALKIKKVNCILNIIRNGSDMPIACSGIWKWKGIPPGLFPFLGSISSFIACYQVWPTPPKPTAVVTAVVPPTATPPTDSNSNSIFLYKYSDPKFYKKVLSINSVNSAAAVIPVVIANAAIFIHNSLSCSCID